MMRELIFLVLCLASIAIPAQAAPICGDRDYLVGQLKAGYQETAVASGIVNETKLMEIFVSRAGTWTILITTVAGQSCIIGAGEGWEPVPSEPPGKPL